MYPENMIPTWKEDAEVLLQIPFCYIVHDKDHLSDVFLKNELKSCEDLKRKEHVHMILAFPNTTTQKHALTVFNTLCLPGKQCIPGNHIQQIFNIRRAYDYLLHDTEDCKKKGKYLYDAAERVTGNLFDIGAFEQISFVEKDNMRKELAKMIISENITNYLDFYNIVCERFDPDAGYEGVASAYSGFFEKLTKGCYQRNRNKEYMLNLKAAIRANARESAESDT